jgi:hypothetical protein
MAGPYYVDPAGSNTSPYDTWTKAATNIQTALDLAVAGEIIYCRGTQTLAATIDVDTNAGTNAGGWIRVIGCNSSGNVDGTRFVLNANGGTFHVMTFTGTSDMYWFENIEVKNTAAGTYHGFYASSAQSSGIVFINCCANTCGAVGFQFDSTNSIFAFLWRCVAYSNGTHGFFVWGRLFFCVARDNATTGFSGSFQLYGCVSHGNSDDGFGSLTGNSTLLVNCVSDENADDGANCSAGTSLSGANLIGCRITNHSGAGDNGLITYDEPCIVGYCYFEDNDDNIAGASHDATPNATFQFIPLENSSATSNVEDQADTNEGYVDKTNHDFSTNYVSGTDPHARRMAITLPWS